MSVRSKGEGETFQDKNKLKEFTTLKPDTQRILEGLFKTKEKDRYPKEATGKNKQCQSSPSKCIFFKKKIKKS